MSLKHISYTELWQPFRSVEWNHLCNFGRGYYEKQFCEIILNLDQWFRRRCLFTIFLIWSSGGPFVQRSGTICAIFIEGIMRNNLNLDQWFRRRCLLKIFVTWSSGGPFIQRSRTTCGILVECINMNFLSNYF